MNRAQKPGPRRRRRRIGPPAVAGRRRAARSTSRWSTSATSRAATPQTPSTILMRKGIKFAAAARPGPRRAGRAAAAVRLRLAPRRRHRRRRGTVNRLFRIAAEQRLAICQPAIGAGGRVVQGAREPTPGTCCATRGSSKSCARSLRRRRCRKSLPLFVANRSAWGSTGSGRRGSARNEVAVIDAAAMRPHAAARTPAAIHKRFAAQGIDPRRDHRRADAPTRHPTTGGSTARPAAARPASAELKLDGSRVWTRTLWQMLFQRKAA